MCNYCVSRMDVTNELKPLYFKSVSWVGVIENDKGEIVLDIDCEELDLEIKINYCPMCGRRLNEE